MTRRHGRRASRCALGAGAGQDQGGWRRLQCYVRARLHRRIFLWFGASILVTGLVVAATLALAVGRRGTQWAQEVERAREFLGGRFARVWDDPAQRDELAAAVAGELGLDVRVEAPDGRALATFGRRSAWGERCEGHEQAVIVTRGDEVLGRVRIASARTHEGWWPLALILLVAGAMLWAASGAIARRVVRPLIELERVVREIGEGKLSSRAALGRGRDDELGVVAEAVNDMAARIERQIGAQRVLLATVSHEMRTPLAHLRVLVELAREELAAPHVADEMERELVEADALIGELLASSQLDVAALRPSALEANEVARRAAERAGLPPAALSPADGEVPFEGDPTLLARALANLLDNARKHGGGATALRVVRGREARTVRFEVEDAGPGFRGVEPSRAFESFSRGDGRGDDGEPTSQPHASLGLGLALVKRIATAHRGSAGAENLSAASTSSGARVWIELPLAAHDRP